MRNTGYDYEQTDGFGNTTRTTYDNFGNVYIWDSSENVATRPLVWMCGISVAYYTHDGNKNVNEIIAADGSLAAHYKYAPFGAIIVQRGEIAVLNPWRFSGEYSDDELGCNYYNYREYEPQGGRWMNRDPFGETLLESGYLFVVNQVVNLVDVLGLVRDELRTCESVILAGHSFQISDMFSKLRVEQNASKKRRSICGNRYGAVSCTSDQTNKWIQDQLPGQGIPGIPTNPGTTFYVDVQIPNEFDAISQLEKAWKAAIAAAREDCGKAGTCCNKIAVSIICSEDPNPTDKSGEPGMRRHLQEVSKQFKKMNKKYQRPTDWCGKKTIISCKDFKREK